MTSPIETMLLDALLETLPESGVSVIVYSCPAEPASPDSLPPADDGEWYASASPKAEAVLFTNAKVFGYRPDIFLMLKALTGAFVVPVDIECDGHEFHERTQQQAAYDRARDRELLRHGVMTIRFTGSEISRDRYQCAGEIVAVLKAWHGHLWQVADLMLCQALEDAKKPEPAVAP